MFYSHTFLARKGPLGTVWCAAHLQHKLKKSHYASTDIPSTVERIIFPEVPIALRMSGHLLLGVVRIYSKKVDYLHHDCNALWVSFRNAFRSVDVNLPENATQAQFNAVTLPETYALDALDIDDDLSLVIGSQDNHLRSQEEITLKDQFAAEGDLYVRITFDDDIIPESSHPAVSPQMESYPMQIDAPRVPSPICNAGPNINEERHERSEGGTFLPPEVMRDRQDDDIHLPSPILRPHSGNIAPVPNISPPKNTYEKETDTPLSVHIVTPQLQPRQSPERSGPSSPSPSGARLVSDSFVNVASTDLLLRPTPSPQQPQPRRQRRRRQLFDEILVLTNEFCRKALNDCSGLVKKRKKLPCSDLEMKRFKDKKRREAVFSEPLISGMSDNLHSLTSKDLTSFNRNLLVSDEAPVESTAAESREPISSVGRETERLRSPDHDPRHDFEQMFPSSPPLSPPQSHGTAGTHSSPRIPSTISEPRFASTVDTQSDLGMFTRSTGLVMDTPMTDFVVKDDISTALSDIPERRNSMEFDDLSFLEQDNSPPDSQGAREGGTMSVRTRAVAQYLKYHSPLSKLNGRSEDISLCTILEGRRRKLCARMFYETLVLKDYGLIDVQQDKAYGDIILKLTPLSMAKI